MTAFKTLRSAALLCLVLSLAPAAHAQAAPAGKKILMLIQAGGPNRATDEQVRSHLQARGFEVGLADQSARPDSAAGFSLVVISSTVSGKDVDPAWRQSPVPLLTWENDLLDDLAMTGKRHDSDFGTTEKERFLWLVNAPHPMAGGQPAGRVNVYRKQAPMGWGRPGLGATTIATVYGQPEKAAIFGYEKGATMDYEALAPARRVMVFLDNDSFGNLSEAGVQLFDAAIDWAAGSR
ncbi:hypothetical protein M5C99_12920 [Acidovorax sp. NCPPB 2350]|nr:hypothetical protein M5C99_12920 [Acidovorax sp. NCPPB 2350]